MKTSLTKKLIQIPVAAAFAACLGLACQAQAQAQGNSTPSSWGSLIVKVTETYGGNQSRPMRGAKVTIDYAEPDKATAYSRDHSLNIRMPQTKTSGPRGAMLGRIAPSNLVGTYTVTVDPKPGDHERKEYACKAKTKTFSMGSRIKNLQFNFKCLSADSQNAQQRRRAGGGHDLIINVKQNGGRRGNGLWVAVYDKDNNRLNWIRTAGSHKVTIRSVTAAGSPYRVVVHKGKNDGKPLFEGTYTMPNNDALYTADLDSAENNEGKCHSVEIRRTSGGNQRTKTEACMVNGSWVISPYKY